MSPSDSPAGPDLLAGSWPVAPAIPRLCANCGAVFLTTVPRPWCDDECGEEGPRDETRMERLHVSASVAPGDFIQYRSEQWVMVAMITHSDLESVGDFVPLSDIAASSPLHGEKTDG